MYAKVQSPNDNIRKIGRNRKINFKNRKLYPVDML